MSLVIQSLSAGNKEQEFREKYAHCYFLGSDHEGVTERYSIESDSDEFNFGLGVGIAITSVKPKALIAREHQVLFIGFDSFISAVSSSNLLLATERKLIRLDGVFIDMFLLENENVCVIHELGALVVTPDLAKVWSVSTDVISDWSVGDERETLRLTEADSGSVMYLSVLTGKNVSIKT
jgi:hypothetical protein